MFDLRRLRVLQVLDERGTVTATAAALHLTPSAVSQQIRQLARDLGVELLAHEGRRVRLTPAARILLTHADTLSAQWERARSDLAAQRDNKVAGSLRMCAVSSAIAAVLAPATARLQRDHPDLRVHLREEESGDCFRLLLAGEADLAVVLPTTDTPPVTDARFDQVALLDDPQDLLVPRGHRLDRPDGTTLTDAAGEPWIVKEHNNDTYPLLVAACAAAGFTPHIAHHVKEWFAVSAMVGEGFGVCLLPRMVPVPSAHAVVRVPLHGKPSPSRRMLACVRRGSADHPVVAAGLAALHEASARL